MYASVEEETESVVTVTYCSNYKAEEDTGIVKQADKKEHLPKSRRLQRGSECSEASCKQHSTYNIVSAL